MQAPADSMDYAPSPLVGAATEEIKADPVRTVTVAEIVNGTRCSPFTLKEFEEFLIHQEHSVENLLFTVWYRSYCDRWTALPAEVKALSPPPEERFSAYATPSMKTSSVRTASIMGGDDDGWWSKLTRRKSTSGRSISSQEEKGSDDAVEQYRRAQEKDGKSEDPLTGLGTGELRIDINNAEPYEPFSKSEDDLFGSQVSLKGAMNGGQPFVGTAFPPSPKALADAQFRKQSPVVDKAEQTEEVDDFEPYPTQLASHHQKYDLSRVDTYRSDVTTGTTKTKSKLGGLRFAGLSAIASRDTRPLPADTPLPFIEEIKLVMTTFIVPGSSRELNLDGRLRKHILKSLAPVQEDGTKGPPMTTHPDVFKEAQEHCFDLMEHSLGKYLGWVKGNINTPKVLFWMGVGVTDFLIGVMIALVCVFCAHKRWWRLTAWLFLDFGIMQFYSATRYFCTQVHGRTARQLYPWELTAMLNEDENSGAPPKTGRASDFVHSSKKSSGIVTDKHRADIAASLPFLFEEGNDWDFETRSLSGVSVAPSVGAASTKSGKLTRRKNVTRSKWFSTLRKKDGDKVPIFGPERVIEDEWIKEKHQKQVKEILIVGFVLTAVIEAAFLAIPQQAV